MDQIAKIFPTQFSYFNIARDYVPPQFKDIIVAQCQKNNANWMAISNSVKSLTENHIQTSKAFGDKIADNIAKSSDDARNLVQSLFEARSFADMSKVQADFAAKQVASYVDWSQTSLQLMTAYVGAAATIATAINTNVGSN